MIPIANLWKPFQATRELHKASAGGSVVEAPTPALLGWWWAGWIVFNVMDGVASAFFAGDDVSIGSYMVGDRFSIAGDLLSTAAAVLAILVVREVIRGQATLRSAPVFASTCRRGPICGTGGSAPPTRLPRWPSRSTSTTSRASPGWRSPTTRRRRSAASSG